MEIKLANETNTKNSDVVEKKISKSNSEILMENSEILPGIYSSLHNAEKFLKSTKDLYEKKDFQASIALATISLEECMKGIELSNRFKRNQNISNEDYSNLTNHKYKLVHAKEDAIEEMKGQSEQEFEKNKIELQKAGIDIPEIDPEKFTKGLEKMAADHSFFQKLREGCFYTGWNKLREKWTLFDELSMDHQEKLAFYVMTEAEKQIDFLHLMIERFVNNLRKTGQLTESLPFPKYTEYREMKDYESLITFNKELSKLEKIKYLQGRKVMQQFILEGSFEFISFGIFSKSMLEYLNVIRKQNEKNWYPHPMIKAMMMAMSLAHEKSKDGKNVLAVSTDSDASSDGKPWMSFAVVANMKSGICNVEEITELSHEKYIFNDEVIEKILRTDITLERNEGKEILTSSFIEALSKIGIKAKMIKQEELADAIKYAKESIGKGKMVGVPKKIIDDILAVKDVGEWDHLDTMTRTLIIMPYGLSKYDGYSLFLTPSEKLLKSRCRLIILDTIQKKLLESA